MATTTSPFVRGTPVSSIPPVPGLPLLGNILAFRKDRLALQDDAARTGPIARIQLAHLPIYIVTDADIAHEVLVDQAAAFRKSAGIEFLKEAVDVGAISRLGSGSDLSPRDSAVGVRLRQNSVRDHH